MEEQGRSAGKAGQELRQSTSPWSDELTTGVGFEVMSMILSLHICRLGGGEAVARERARLI